MVWPLRVVHGTPDPLSDTLDPGKGKSGHGQSIYGKGVYLSSDPQVASGYARKSGCVYPCYVKISNPFVIGESTLSGKGKEKLLAIWTEEVNEHWAKSQVSNFDKGRIPEPWYGLSKEIKTDILS